MNYSERDLLNIVRDCAFAEIHLQFHVDVMPCPVTSWEVYLDVSPHPWAPSLREMFTEQFTPDERQLFEQVLRPIVESGTNTAVNRMAYLNARKPSA